MSTLFGSAAAAQSSASTSGDLSKDIALTDPPSDSVSDLSFSPAANFLAVASWDKKVRIYEVGEDGKSEGRAAIDFEAPALACAWSNVSTKQQDCLRVQLLTASGWHQSRRSRRRQKHPHARSRLAW